MDPHPQGCLGKQVLLQVAFKIASGTAWKSTVPVSLSYQKDYIYEKVYCVQPPHLKIQSHLKETSRNNQPLLHLITHAVLYIFTLSSLSYSHSLSSELHMCFHYDKGNNFKQ